MSVFEFWMIVSVLLQIVSVVCMVLGVERRPILAKIVSELLSALSIACISEAGRHG